MISFLEERSTPTSQDIEQRSSTTTDTNESSSSSSDYCHRNPNSAECEKPVNSNSLIIGLCIALPCFAIFCVLGFFLYRNYRKDKKESLEHDPDFDENGEATALPDYPGIRGVQENPFHSRNSIRYPMEQIEKGYTGDSGGGGGYEKGEFQYYQYSRQEPPYVDSVVLPYQHQSSSKLSLDDYARQLGDPSVRPRTRTSSLHMEKMPYSQSRVPSSQNSPTKKVQGRQYTGVPNVSNVALEENLHDASHITEMSDESDSIENQPRQRDFGVTYENESDVSINKTIPQIVVSEEDSSSQPQDTTTESQSLSPFDNDENNHQTEDTMDDSISPKTSPLKDNDNDDAANDDDDDDADNFQFSTKKSRFNFEDVATKQGTKSPRISAFNLLTNDSDNENDDNLDHLTPQQEEEIKRMKSVYKIYFDRDTDKGNSKNIQADENYSLPMHKINDKMHVDASYGNRYSNTSSVYVDTDSIQQEQNQQQYQQRYHQQHQQQQQRQQNYYNQFNQQYQQQYGTPVDPQLYQQYQQKQYHYFQSQQHNNQQQWQWQQQQQQQQQPLQRPLPPLQRLPNPSDLRKSSLQTFTDFKQSEKNHVVTSPPTGKHPFVPIENDAVWTSPVSSPKTQTQGAFPQQQQQQQQQQQHSQQDLTSQQYYQIQLQQNKTVPSATQLARSSVVMINPVTEITKSRKFKPAGSLPSSNNLHQQFGYSDLNGPENDLLPGNRKSDVRRMMNTNF
ncbi:hypothetical protein KGF56_004052 [Candida oxycetoniae]|uniref:Uncharacterized protein n=1 Tax=Candida oxycetoniae TaxID=497107 RepID=A0AAI9SUX6_9ASCO|nr:uncharacterized protein KGF56_004052 [Candida oxycetoniae]KAI3403163.2 hypothetical protein KGF56_004052 [Candida oxycetoniae]